MSVIAEARIVNTRSSSGCSVTGSIRPLNASPETSPVSLIQLVPPLPPGIVPRSVSSPLCHIVACETKQSFKQNGGMAGVRVSVAAASTPWLLMFRDCSNPEKLPGPPSVPVSMTLYRRCSGLPFLLSV